MGQFNWRSTFAFGDGKEGKTKLTGLVPVSF